MSSTEINPVESLVLNPDESLVLLDLPKAISETGKFFNGYTHTPPEKREFGYLQEIKPIEYYPFNPNSAIFVFVKDGKRKEYELSLYQHFLILFEGRMYNFNFKFYRGLDKNGTILGYLKSYNTMNHRDCYTFIKPGDYRPTIIHKNAMGVFENLLEKNKLEPAPNVDKESLLERLHKGGW